MDFAPSGGGICPEEVLNFPDLPNQGEFGTISRDLAQELREEVQRVGNDVPQQLWPTTQPQPEEQVRDQFGMDSGLVC